MSYEKGQKEYTNCLTLPMTADTPSRIHETDVSALVSV